MKKNIVLTVVLLAILAAPAFAQTVTYNFKPPQNNFYIKWKDNNGVTHFHGYIKGGLWSGNTKGDEYFSTPDGKTYYRDNNRWYLDDYADSGDVKMWFVNHLAEPEMLGSYYTNFWKRYNAAAGGNLRASLYHKGQEKFLGINCDIFIDNMNLRYWIDTSNGCTLKIAAANGAVGYEVTEYNLNFTSWPAGLPPR
jgi:hypothetical protein